MVANRSTSWLLAAVLSISTSALGLSSAHAENGDHEAIQALVKNGVVEIQGQIQPYEWGPIDGISKFFGWPTTGGHEAELWLGAHDQAPSKILVDGHSVALNRIMKQVPRVVLGNTVARQYNNQYPNLMKVLFAGAPLSIQSHPNKAQAAEGFAREQGTQPAIPKDKRNYRDANHKPELIVNIGNQPFHALSSFRPYEEIRSFLGSIAELATISRGFEASPAGLSRTYAEIMSMNERELVAKLGPWLQDLRGQADGKSFGPNTRNHWILASHELYSKKGVPDRGLASFGLLNYVPLSTGHAAFLEAGELHAYLNGLGIEVMANSDNVLRGGLTGKHIDVDELLKVGQFAPKEPNIISEPLKEGDASFAYKTPFQEFELSRIELGPKTKQHRARKTEGPHIGLVTEGAVEIHIEGKRGTGLKLKKGQSFLARHGVKYTVHSKGGPATVYRTKVPTLRH